MTTTRTESDSMGPLEVPEDALWGAQTQRAINNFPVSGISMPAGFIEALLMNKRAAAQANLLLEQLSQTRADAIVRACNQLLSDDELMSHFPVDVFQTGSGTSSNMNANEVITTLANRLIDPASDEAVGANDHVNYGQSSNDIIPTTIHVSAALALENEVLPALRHLASSIRTKADEVAEYVKTGRTHLMDAMPVTMAQSLGAWATQVEQNIHVLSSLQPQLQSLAQGGTAVGTGINAHPDFAVTFAEQLSMATGLTFRPHDDFFTAIATQDTAVAVSGQLKTLAVSLMKIANDLRWMNSGPLAGLGEIELEALQPGSSIMPGKVNPVIPEAAAMVTAQVIGNDTTITAGGQSGNFELNVMLPVIGFNLLQSMELIANISRLLADKAIATFTVREDELKKALDRNPILVTALNPIIGYMKAAEIAKKAYAEGRAIIDVAEEQTDLSRTELSELLNTAKLAQPHN